MITFIKKIFGLQKENPFKDRLILYVDDNEIEREVISRVLKKNQFRVSLCASAEEAFEQLKEEKPALILLDVVLPGLSGIDLCKYLKKDMATQNIPVIFLTSMDSPQTLIDCYEFGAEDFFNKNVSLSLLIRQIKIVLEDYETNPELSAKIDF